MTYHSSTTGIVPCSLFLKCEVRTRFDLLRPDGGAQVQDKQAQQKADHVCHTRTHEFVVGDRVLAKNVHPGSD